MKYASGTVIVDGAIREVIVGDAVVQVEPKVFDLILYLIEARERVVTKEELVTAIWQGRFISDAAISSAVSAARRALRDNGREQRILRTVHGRGFRFIAPVVQVPEPVEAASATGTQKGIRQVIRYCRSADGTRIAYAIAGSGPPIVKAANWLHHLEFDWDSPVWRHYFAEFAAVNMLLRYDGRGMGLSDWNVTDFSLERQVEDLEAVVAASDIKKFALLGISQGCARSVIYAARHPERVTKLILIGGYARGWKRRDDADTAVLRNAMVDMIRVGWGRDNPAVHRMMTALYMPDAPPESQTWFSDLQRKTTSATNAAATIEEHGGLDLRDLLPRLKLPTLVIHARHDAGVPFSQGQELAAGIPGAQFAVLDTTNHILPATDPAWQRCARLIREFLAT